MKQSHGSLHWQNAVMSTFGVDLHAACTTSPLQSPAPALRFALFDDYTPADVHSWPCKLTGISDHGCVQDADAVVPTFASACATITVITIRSTYLSCSFALTSGHRGSADCLERSVHADRDRQLP